MRTLMPIKTAGSHKPLFCINGQPLKMARYFDERYPLYGLCDAYHPNFRAPRKIEQLAEMYVREVQLVQPEGPYYIFGFSMGGLIAYEMAKQLLEKGEKIAYLSLIDPTIWGMHRAPDDWVATRWEWVWESLSTPGQRLNGLKNVIERTFNSLKAQTITFGRRCMIAFHEILGTEMPVELRRLKCAPAIKASCYHHRYEEIPIPAVVFHTALEPEYQKQYSDFWNNIFIDGAEIRSMENVKNHMEFLDDEHLEAVSHLIAADLEQLGQA